MRLMDFIYSVIGFMVVMNILQATGILDTNLTIQDYTNIFIGGTILGLAGVLGGAAAATILRPNSTPERSIMYGSFALIIPTFYLLAFAPIDALLSGIPQEGQIVITLLMGGIKFLFLIVIWYSLFQVVFGGGEGYQ